MQLIVKLRPEQATMVRALVGRGDYASYHEFVAIAVDNQLSLETGEQAPPAKGESVRPGPELAAVHSLVAPVSRDGPVARVTRSFETPAGPIWGQYNRYAPALLAVRVLARMTEVAATSWVPAQTYWDQSAAAAETIGEKLRSTDKMRGNKRGNRLDTAFPLGADRHKSARRFQQQFAGALAKRTSEPIGMAAELGLVALETHDGRLEAGVTKLGRSLAALTFPAMDEDTPARTLSDAQVSFIIENVMRCMPREAGLAIALMDALGSGNASLQDLNEAVSSFDTSWNSDVASTMRGGMMGRLNEMGLISISREGLNGKYTITPAGELALLTLKRID